MGSISASTSGKSRSRRIEGKQQNSDIKDDKKIQARIHTKDFESIESLERYIQQPTSFLGKKTLLI